MLETIRDIISASDLAVLATCADNQPHCSLMAYAVHNDSSILMLTRRETRKFKNISANPRVSVMVDTRLESSEQRFAIKALTINGVCSPCSKHEQKRLKDLLVVQHPQLKELAALEDSVVVEVKADSFLLLDGVSNAFFLDLST